MQYLELADGTRIDPKDGKPMPEHKEFIPAPAQEEDELPITAVVRRIDDLPLPPKQMNAVVVVLGYTFLGMNYWDIAEITGLDENALRGLMFSDEYKEVKRMMLDGILAIDGDNVRAMIARKARDAANEMFTQLERSKDESARRDVAKDILDRAGHRPADVVNHNMRINAGLTIEVIKRDESKVGPVLDQESF